jgi:hypothetical protein
MADAPGDRSDPDTGSRGRTGDPEPGAAEPGAAARPRPGADPLRRKGEADAWNAVSLVLAGMLLWGGLGWLLGREVGLPALTGLGLVLGTGGGLALVWLRYGRST